MRISDLLTGLDRDKLHDLTLRIPGGQDLEASSRAYHLEFALCQFAWVEQTIFARRPPVTSLLLRLVDAEDHVIEIDRVREEIADEVETWCQQVTSGDLSNRIPDRSRIYRRMLEAAWRNDSVLDTSEVRLLRLLRDELGLLRIEHFLLAHHASIQPCWRSENALDEVIRDLADHGIVFLPEPGKLAIPDELVPHVRRSLGVSLSKDAAQRLLQCLDSGSHLKAALADHELPTSGSKQDRIDRLVQHFVPMTRVVDTMHIHEARELARSLGLPIKGAKEELVTRIVEHFAANGDLAIEEEHEEEPEGKSLLESKFAELFDGLKGYQLQQLLLAFDLRHSGSKQTRISTLWDSPYSESTLLSKLKNPDLDSLLSKSELVCRGSKADKIGALLDAFRTTNDPMVRESKASDREEPSSDQGIVAELGELLSGVELSSTSPTRFDQVREILAERLHVDPSSVAVKWLGDPRNHRNRISEALRSRPTVLVLLAPREEGDVVLEAAHSRMALSADTHFVTLLSSEDRPIWTSGSIMSAVETMVVEDLGRMLPDAEIQLVGYPREVERAHVLDLVKRVQKELAVEWPKDDLPAESRVRRGLRRAFGRTDTVVRTKHISDSRNIGNRISEAVGAGCGALVLIVAHEVADATRAEVQRQLGSVREPALAVLIAEAEDGYAEPQIITASDPV